MHRSIHQYFTNCSFELGRVWKTSNMVFFKWRTSWPLWINLVKKKKKGRAEYVDNCHWKNWKLNWSHPGFQEALGSRLKRKPLQMEPGIVRPERLCQIYSFSSHWQASSVSNNSYFLEQFMENKQRNRVQSTPTHTQMMTEFITLYELELNFLHPKLLELQSGCTLFFFFWH